MYIHFHIMVLYCGINYGIILKLKIHLVILSDIYISGKDPDVCVQVCSSTQLI